MTSPRLPLPARPQLPPPLRPFWGLLLLGCTVAQPRAGAAPAKPAAEKPEAALVAADPRWPFRDAPPVAEKPAQGGVGLVLELKDGHVQIAQVSPGGPAARAGVRPGDVLVSIDAWALPADAKVADAATHIRGPAGSRTRLTVRRAGQAVVLEVERTPMDRMFPNVSKGLLSVHDGFALLATGNQGTLGVRFQDPSKPDGLIPYTWRAAEGDKALNAEGGQTGAGLVSIDAVAGCTVQILDWKLDLKRGESGVYVAASNLAVHEVDAKLDWLQIAPPFSSYVKPRTAAKAKTPRWDGPHRLRVQLLVHSTDSTAPKPVADRRVTLRLALTGSPGVALVVHDSLPAVSDAQGRVEFPVPAGTWRVLGLQPSTPGGQRDAAFDHELAQSATSLTIDATRTATTVLDVQRKAPSAGSVEDWATDARVGQGLPRLDVQRWLLPRPQPKSLQGQVLLLYVWATWCGPCRATAPMVAEVAARLKGQNLQVVAASVDRDELALEEYAKDELPGAPTIAWLGTDGMTTLDLDSVPTFLVVDATGRIRGVHRGSGWSVDALEAWLRSLLAEAPRQ